MAVSTSIILFSSFIKYAAYLVCRILLEPKHFLLLLLEFGPCGSCSSLHNLSRNARAVLNEPNLIPGLTNRLMNLWSCSTILFAYLNDCQAVASTTDIQLRARDRPIVITNLPSEPLLIPLWMSRYSGVKSNTLLLNSV